jgi:hypothetical protein
MASLFRDPNDTSASSNVELGKEPFLASFEIFSQLPQEIQDQIWQISVPAVRPTAHLVRLDRISLPTKDAASSEGEDSSALATVVLRSRDELGFPVRDRMVGPGSWMIFSEEDAHEAGKETDRVRVLRTLLCTCRNSRQVALQEVQRTSKSAKVYLMSGPRRPIPIGSAETSISRVRAVDAGADLLVLRVFLKERDGLWRMPGVFSDRHTVRHLAVFDHGPNNLTLERERHSWLTRECLPQLLNLVAPLSFLDTFYLVVHPDRLRRLQGPIRNGKTSIRLGGKFNKAAHFLADYEANSRVDRVASWGGSYLDDDSGPVDVEYYEIGIDVVKGMGRYSVAMALLRAISLGARVNRSEKSSLKVRLMSWRPTLSRPITA